jgi:hypothetical protein
MQASFKLSGEFMVFNMGRLQIVWWGIEGLFRGFNTIKYPDYGFIYKLIIPLGLIEIRVFAKFLKKAF